MTIRIAFICNNHIYHQSLKIGAKLTIGSNTNDTLFIPGLKPSQITLINDFSNHIRISMKIGRKTVEEELPLDRYLILDSTQNMEIFATEEKDIAEVKFGLLSCKYSLKIGRHSQNDIILCNRYVSKQHMILSCDGRDIYLEDCNSTCGTYVNGKRIRRTTLYPGDMISILTMQIKLEKSELVFEQFDGQILFKDIDEDSATICFFS